MKRTASRAGFRERVEWWASHLEVRARAVTLRRMQNKWASCSTAGRLTFEVDLLSQPPDVQDYVIVHELLHLRVPNHGKLWKSLMRAHLGDYEALEHRLMLAARAQLRRTPSRRS